MPNLVKMRTVIENHIKCFNESIRMFWVQQRSRSMVQDEIANLPALEPFSVKPEDSSPAAGVPPFPWIERFRIAHTFRNSARNDCVVLILANLYPWTDHVSIFFTFYIQRGYFLICFCLPHFRESLLNTFYADISLYFKRIHCSGESFDLCPSFSLSLVLSVSLVTHTLKICFVL